MARRHLRYADNPIRNEARVERQSDWRRRCISVTVGPESGHGWRLDRYLALALGSYSRSLIKRWFDHGYIRLNGQTAKPGWRVAGNDVCRLEIPHPPPPAEHQTTPAVLHILHEEPGLLVCNKPVGQLAHPAGRVLSGTLLNQIQELLASRGEDWSRARLVNRIDRDTSGIVLATTDPALHARCCAALRAGDFDKRYLAICLGAPASDHGDWREAIADPLDTRTIARRIDPAGQPSHTGFRVIARAPADRYCLLGFELHTGRQHQIRIHAAHHGHPLVGDWVYGEPCAELVGQALHAAGLRFTHPRTGRPLSIEAPLIGDLCDLWDHLAAGGSVTPRPLLPSEARRLGQVPPPEQPPLPHGHRRPSWMSEAELTRIRRETCE